MCNDCIQYTPISHYIKSSNFKNTQVSPCAIEAALAPWVMLPRRCVWHQDVVGGLFGYFGCGLGIPLIGLVCPVHPK